MSRGILTYMGFLFFLLRINLHMKYRDVFFSLFKEGRMESGNCEHTTHS